MAVKKNGQKTKRRLSNAVRSKTRRLRPVAANPALPQSRDDKPRATAPRPESQPSRFATEFVADAAADKADRLPSVMLVITILALVFIGLITWFVAHMPEK
jgi:hypothetical protein